MAQVHEKFIKNYLYKKPAILSTQLISAVKKEFPNCNETNIRKIISNTAKKGLINSSAPMTFGNNQYAYFSANKKLSYDILRHLIQDHKPTLFRVITALHLNNGILTLNELYKISGCKSSGKSNVLTVKDILNDLTLLDYANYDFDGDIKFIYSKQIENAKDSVYQLCETRLAEESILLSCAITWLKKINMIDSQIVVFKGKTNNYNGVEMNNTYWDATSFTTTVGYKDYSQDEKSIVVLDFLYNRPYEAFDLDGFLARINMTIHSVKTKKRKILPIIFAPSFSRAAISKIKSSSIIMFDFNSVFGTNALDIVKRHVSMQQATEVDPKDISDLLDQIEHSNMSDNYSNIKGDLFEYLMRPVFEKIWNGANISHSVTAKGFEYDYIIEAASEYIIIELKGYKQDSIIKLGKFNDKKQKPQRDTVKWFLSHTFPKAKEVYETNPTNRKVKLCYITTASFDEDAIKALEDKNKSKEKPNDIDCYYDGNKLRKLLKKYSADNELQILNRYYLTEPEF